MEDSELVNGIVINKDVMNPLKMPRVKKNPRLVLLDLPIELTNEGVKANLELKKISDYDKLLKIEEDYIKTICDKIIDKRVDIVVSEKGVCDLAAHFLQSRGICILRRIKKSDN